MFSTEQDHHESTLTRPEKSKSREYSYLSLLTFPAADTFNLISAKYKNPVICL